MKRNILLPAIFACLLFSCISPSKKVNVPTEELVSPSPTPTVIRQPSATLALLKTPDLPGTAVPAGLLTVTSVENLNLPVGEAYLSPNGNFIAWTDGHDLCVYTSTSQKENCVTSDKSIDPTSVRWSPDEKRLAFIDDINNTVETNVWDEPDLWVMDRGTYILRNLTPDGADTVAPNHLSGDWDVAPHWLSDSKTLIFVRYSGSGTEKEYHPTIYSINADNQMPELVTDIDNPAGLPLDVILTSSIDGKYIGYGMDYIAAENEGTEGTWISNGDGTDLRELLPMLDDHDGTPFDIEFSADGHYLMTLYNYLMPLEQMTWSAVRIVEVESGHEVPATAEEAAYSIGNLQNQRWATWSPKGSAFLYILTNDINSEDYKYEAGLYLVEKPGANPRLIYPGHFWAPFKKALNRTITWATNNTILVTNQGNLHLLIHLGVK